MNFFGVVSFIYDVKVGLSDSVTLFQVFLWRVRYRGPEREDL